MVLVCHELSFTMASSSTVLLSGYVKVNGKGQAAWIIQKYHAVIGEQVIKKKETLSQSINQ